MRGFVKNVVANRNFGFIRCGQTEYFFHREDFNGHWDDLVADMLKPGKVEVEYDIVESQKGPRAANVRRLDFPNQT